MKLGRLNSGEKIAGISALMLLIFMFFDWFGIESSDDSRPFFNVGHSAWDALDWIPIVLLFAILAALIVAVLRLMSIVHKRSALANAVVAILGVVSVLLILFRIIDPPNFGSFGTSFGTVTIEGTVQLPIFFALLAAAGIAFGGWRGYAGRIGFADRRC